MQFLTNNEVHLSRYIRVFKFSILENIAHVSYKVLILYLLYVFSVSYVCHQITYKSV
jgi:hypothetical protein